MAPKRNGSRKMTGSTNAKKWTRKSDSQDSMRDERAALDAPGVDTPSTPSTKSGQMILAMNGQWIFQERPEDSSLAADTPCPSVHEDVSTRPNVAVNGETKPDAECIEQQADSSLATETPSAPVQGEVSKSSNDALGGETNPDAECIDTSIGQPEDSSLAMDTPSTQMQEDVSTRSNGEVNGETSLDDGCIDKSIEQPADSSLAQDTPSTPSNPVQEDVSTRSNNEVNVETKDAKYVGNDIEQSPETSEARPATPKAVNDAVAVPTRTELEGAVCGRSCIGRFWQKLTPKRARRVA